MKVMRFVGVAAIMVATTIGMALAQAPQGAPGAGGGGQGRGAGAPGGGAPGAGGPGGGGQGRGGAGGGGGRGGGPAFNVTSPSFVDGGEIPMKHAFRGENMSPQFDFHWFNGAAPAEQPATVQTFAIIFRDMENATARGPEDTLHWAVFNIPGTAKGLPGGLAGGVLPDGTTNGPGIGNRGGAGGSYFGPGAGVGPFHHYMFEFFALDVKLDVPATVSRADLLKAMEGHVVGKAVYGGRFHTAQ
jgi:Raf kinase inhibitor-like YbhB/YbcL family protein